MAFTKPADIAIQLIAMNLLVISILPVMASNYFIAVVMWGIAIWLMMISRKPTFRG